MQKICKKHGLVEHSQAKSSTTKSGFILRCNKCNSETTMARTRELKTMAIELKGGRCAMCGYNRCVNALEFHHVDPLQKDLSISVMIRSRSWKSIKKELEKCILICANCHAEVHMGTQNGSPLS